MSDAIEEARRILLAERERIDAALRALGAEDPPSKPKGKKASNGLPKALNKGTTWAEEVDGVLSDEAPVDGFTVQEIVETLRRRGLQFGDSRPDTIIRSVLKRRARAMSWELASSNPQRWRKMDLMNPF